MVSARVFAEPPTISKLFVQLHQLDDIVAVHCQFIFAAPVSICIQLGALFFKPADGSAMRDSLRARYHLRITTR